MRPGAVKDMYGTGGHGLTLKTAAGRILYEAAVSDPKVFLLTNSADSSPISFLNCL